MPNNNSAINKLFGNTQVSNETTPIRTDYSETLIKALNPNNLLFSDESSGIPNSGISNPNFDPSRVEKDQQISNSGLQNAWSTFRRAWLDMNIATEIGKMNLDAGEFGQGALFGMNQSAEEIVDNYANDLKKLDNLRETNQIKESDYYSQLQKLQEDFNKAQTIIAESTANIAEYEKKKEDYVVSNRYAAKTARALQKGDDLGIIENIQYAFPQTFGSSASLMIPQMAAAFGAGFVKGATTTVAGTLGIGTKAAPIVGTIAGVAAAFASLTWGRAQESYGEVGSLIQEAREKMLVDYMRKNNIQDPSQVPEEVLANIRAKSRRGAEMLFKENMTLVAPDLASALLLPMNTLGKTMGVGRLTDKLGVTNIGKLISNAKNYNLWTKGLAFAASRRYAQYLEQFEEGLQYAASDRAKSEIYDLGEYQNKGFIANLLDDSYNTIASLNYTLLPGITPSLRGSGKYALDPEFQSSDNSGALLALIMSAPTSILSIGSELKAYRKSKKDIINNGLFDVDSKFERLNASLLKSYFEKGQVPRLLEAIKVVGREHDEEGNLYYTEEQGQKAINDIKELYAAYRLISDNIDKISKDRFFGFKSSREQKNMVNLVKEDLLTTVMNLKRQSETLPELLNQYTRVLDQEINIASDDINLASLKALRSKEQALRELISIHEENSEIASKTAPKNILQNLKNILEKEVIPSIEAEELKLIDLGINFSNLSEPSVALRESDKNLYVHNEYTKAQKEIYNNLSKIKSQEDLFNYYKSNKNRTNLADVVENITGTEVDVPLTDLRTNEEVIDDETRGYDPDPSAQSGQEQTSTMTVDFLEGVETPQDETYTPTGDIVTDTYNLNQVLDNKAKRILKQDLESFFTDPNFNSETFKELLKRNYIDYKNSSFSNIWDRLVEALGDSEYLRNNFDNIKELISSEQDSALSKITDDSYLDPITLEVVTGKSPFHSYDDSKVDSNNSKVIEDYKEKLEPNPSLGFKIIDPFSIANRQVGLEGRQDSYEEGKLVFKDSGDDQHITNTNVITPGTQVIIRIDNPQILGEINESTDLDSDLNRLELGIYVINNSKGITIPLKIGSVHTTDYYTIETFDPVHISIDNAKDLIRRQRKYILTKLKQDPNTEFTDFITEKGFGFLNLNQVPNTVRNTIGADTRPYLTVVGDSGIPIQIGDKSIYKEIQGFEKGASLLMIPNNTNNGTTYVPIYLIKLPISADPTALREVTNGVNNFLKGPDNIWGTQIDDWIYVTRNPSEKRKLVYNGIVLENNKVRAQKSVTINNITYSYNRNTNVYTIQGTSGNPIAVSEQEFYEGLNRQGVNLPGLNASLSSVYPSLNKNRLLNPKDTNKTYQKKMMNSSVYQTKVAPNTVLLEKSDNLYSFLPEDEKYQYFSQHTITLSGQIQAKSSKTVIPNTNDSEVQQPQTPPNIPQSDLPLGKVGNTQYEVRQDGVYYEGKKLDNPNSLSARELVEEHIKGRQQEELNSDNVRRYEQAVKSFENQLNREINSNKSVQIINTTKDDLRLRQRSLNIVIDKINARYDAEIAELNKQQSSNQSQQESTSEETNKTLTSEEDIADALGDDFIFDIDLQNPMDLPSVKQTITETITRDSNLNNSIYSKLAANPNISAQDLLSSLLKENLIKKQCS